MKYINEKKIKKAFKERISEPRNYFYLVNSIMWAGPPVFSRGRERESIVYETTTCSNRLDKEEALLLLDINSLHRSSTQLQLSTEYMVRKLFAKLALKSPMEELGRLNV